MVAARGDQADYVRNLRHDSAVRIKSGRRWFDGNAIVLPHDDPVERLDWIASQFGRLRRFDARVLGSSIRLPRSTPIVIRIDLLDTRHPNTMEVP